MPKGQRNSNTAVLTVDDIIEAQGLYLKGHPLSKIAKQFKTSAAVLQNRFDRLSAFVKASPTLMSENQLEIKEKVNNSMDKIRTELTEVSVKVLNKSDDIVYDILSTTPQTNAYQVALIGDLYAKRLSRISDLDINKNANGLPANIINIINIDPVVAAKNNIKKEPIEAEIVK